MLRKLNKKLIQNHEYGYRQISRHFLRKTYLYLRMYKYVPKRVGADDNTNQSGSLPLSAAAVLGNWDPQRK